MPGPCCQKPFTTIIKVGTFEAGIVGLEPIMQKLAESESLDDRDASRRLLSMVREHGNYISPAIEELYKVALLREFRLFMQKRALQK